MVSTSTVMCLYLPRDLSQKFGISICDLITGEFLTMETRSFENVKTLVSMYLPDHIYMNESFLQVSIVPLIESLNVKHEFVSDMRFNPMFASEILRKQFNHTTEEMGLSENEYSIGTCGALLFHIEKNPMINKLKILDKNSFLRIDLICMKYLELEKLCKKLDNTKSPLGSRLLRKHLFAPLTDSIKIEGQLEAVDEFNHNSDKRDELRKCLSEVSDIYENIRDKNLKAINVSLEQIPEIKKLLNSFDSKVIKNIRRMDSISEVKDLELSAKKLQDLCEKLSLLDVITTHSCNSEKFNLVRPHINNRSTDIIDSTSLVDFKDIHNMIVARDSDEELEYKKKDALIFILTQIGSFVPAKFASVKIHYKLEPTLTQDKKDSKEDGKSQKEESTLSKFL